MQYLYVTNHENISYQI